MVTYDEALQQLTDADWQVWCDACTGTYDLVDPAGVVMQTDQAGVIATAQALLPCRLTYDQAVVLAVRALEREIAIYTDTCRAHRPALGIDRRTARAAIVALRQGRPRQMELF